MAWIYDPDQQDYTYQDSQDDQSGLAGSSFMDNVFQDQQDRNRNSQVATLDKTLGYQPQDIMDAAKRVVGGLRGYGTTLANYYDLQNQPERPQMSTEQQRQWRIKSQIEADQQAKQAAESADTTNPFDIPRQIGRAYYNQFQGTTNTDEQGNQYLDVRQPVGNMVESGGLNFGSLENAAGSIGRGLRGFGQRAAETGLGQESALPAEIAAATRFRNPLEVSDITELSQDVGQAVQGRHTLQGPANSQLEWRSYPNGNAHIVNVNAGDVQGQGVGTRLLQKAIADIRAANPDAIITADLNSEGGARLFARQPDAEFTDMRGNPISAQEAAAAADRAEGPHVTLPSQPAQRELSMVGGGANLPENLDFATARAALKGLGIDADNMSRADIEKVIQKVNAGKPLSPSDIPQASTPIGDAELEAQSRLNLGLEGSGQPPAEPPTGNDYTAGGGMFGNEPPSGPQGGRVGRPYQPGADFPRGGEPLPGQNTLEPLENAPTYSGPEGGAAANQLSGQRAGIANQQYMADQGQGIPGPREPVFPSQPDIVEPEATKSLAQKVWEGTIGNAGALTGLKSSLTPPFLRQGLARFVTSPVSAIRELATSLRGGLSEANYTKVMDIIEQDPMVRKSAGPIGQANMDSPIPAGYSWQDRGGTILQAGEKADANTLPEELQMWKQSPIGRHLEESKAGGWSERQAALEMNLHRTNWYKEAASALWQSGETDPDRYTALVKEIEHFTQRGSVSQGQVPVMFSTRAISGRIQAANDLLTNGVYRGILRGQALQPGVAREAAKVLAGEAIYNSIRIGVPVALGAGSIELKDGLPTLKIGNQHFDPWAGFGSMSKVVYRTAVAVDKASKGNTGSLSGPQFVGTAAGKELLGYARKSLGPAFGKSADVLSGKDVFGRKYDVEKDVKSGKFLADLAAPLLIGDLFDAFKVAGAGGAALRAPSSFLSEGGNDYVPDKPKSTGFDWSGGGSKSTSGGTSKGFDWSK